MSFDMAEFDRFLRRRGIDPETFVFGHALEDIKAGERGLIELTPEALALIVEFRLKRGEK